MRAAMFRSSLHAGRGLALLAALLLSACKAELYTNLDQRQANEIAATLLQHGIPAQRVAVKGGQYTVVVDNERFAESIAILKEAGLPSRSSRPWGRSSKEDGLVPPMQERAQMIFALSQELSRTVSEIDGVLSARVHLVLPENDPLRQQLVPSSASVFIRHRSNTPVGNLVPQVKMLVANGIAGVSYDKVSVVLVPVDMQKANQGLDLEMVSFFGLWLHRDNVGQAMWDVLRPRRAGPRARSCARLRPLAPARTRLRIGFVAAGFVERGESVVSTASESTGADAGWDAFVTQPARYIEPARLAVCFDGMLGAECARGLQASVRLEERLSGLVHSRYGLARDIAAEAVSDTDRSIALASPEQLAELVRRAGAIYWANSIANTIRAADAAAIDAALGEALCVVALGNRDLSGPMQPLAPYDQLGARVMEDGLRCLGAWCKSQPAGVGLRVRLGSRPILLSTMR